MESSIFLQLSAVLAIAAGISIVMRLLRQPLIIGYILTGLLAGPTALNIITNQTAFESFSQIGITLLLFIVGLGLDIKLIRSTGKPALLVFLMNFIIVCGATFIAGRFFGFTPVESFLLGLGLVFSSTIVVIKALTDDRELSRLHGRLAIGVLLVEDIVATLALIFLAAAKGGSSAEQFIELSAKGMALAAMLTLISWFVLPKVAKFFAASQEFLFTFALAWAFSIAAVFDAAGFSVEVGALFAGVSLASLPYAQEISTRLKPLRDFFLLLFFISMGEHLTLSGINQAIMPALACAVIVSLLKPFSVSNALGFLGYTKQTSFKTSAHLSQVSEFSIVMLALAYSEHLVSSRLVSIVTLTALITIATSTYLMKYDGTLYRRLHRILPVFERPLPPHNEAGKGVSYKLFLFGYHRGGHEFIKTFREMKKPYLVVDYNPEVIETLEREHIHHVYGDATDYELLEEIGVRTAEIVVSVLPGLNTNLTLLRYLNRHHPECIFICHAKDYDDAAELYQKGASYVMLPHFIGSEKMSAFIRTHGNDKAAFDNYRKHHIITLGKAALV